MAVAWYVCLICVHLFVAFVLTRVLISSPLDPPPILFLASAHLLLVYTILRRVHWCWLPYVAVTLGWCLVLSSDSGFVSRGPGAEGAALAELAVVFTALLFGILQLVTLISLLVWRRSWTAPTTAAIAEILVGSLILIGSGILDMRALARKRVVVEQEREQWMADNRENEQLFAHGNGDRAN